MTMEKSEGFGSRRPLRLWPGVAAALLLVVFKLVVLLMGRGEPIEALLGGLAAGVAIGVWWVLFSRAAWVERWAPSS